MPPMSVIDNINNFVYSYKMSRNLDKGKIVLDEILGYLSSFNISDLSRSEKHHIVRKTFEIDVKDPDIQFKSSCDEIIRTLFITCVVKEESEQKLNIAIISPDCPSELLTEQVLQPYQEMLQYSNQTLIFPQSAIPLLPVRAIFWKMIQTYAKDFSLLSLQVQSLNSFVRYPQELFQKIFQDLPLPLDLQDANRLQFYTHVTVVSLLEEPSLQLAMLAESAAKAPILSFCKGMLQYRTLAKQKSSRLIIDKQITSSLTQEQSDKLWERLSTVITSFSPPSIQFTGEDSSYKPHLFSHFCQQRPLIQAFGTPYTIKFPCVESLILPYEILWLCGELFHRMFDMGGNEIKTHEIDFTKDYQDRFIFKQGFEEIVARITQNPINYPFVDMQTDALKAYVNLLPVFKFDPTLFPTMKEIQGHQILFQKLKELNPGLVGFYNEDNRLKMKARVENCKSLESIFSEAIDYLSDIRSLNLKDETTIFTLSRQITLLPKLIEIVLRNCEIDSLPETISELKFLRRVHFLNFAARPWSLPETFKKGANWFSLE